MSPEQKTVIEVEGRTLTVTNLDKVLYPEAGFTKADVIWYYVHVAPYLLPHLEGRPLTMTRYPDGVAGKSFFEKHSARKAPEWARSARVPRTDRSKDSEYIDQLVVDDLATLVFVANLAALELHVPQWRSVVDGSYGPVDLIVFDLDPGAPATDRRVLPGGAVAARRPRRSGPRRLPEDERLQGPAALCPSGPALALGGGPPHGAGDRPADRARASRPRCSRTCAGTCARARCSSTGARTTPPRRRSPPTRCGRSPCRACRRRSAGTRWHEGADGDAEELRFLAPQVLERVESLGDLFAPLTAPGAAAPASSRPGAEREDEVPRRRPRT